MANIKYRGVTTSPATPGSTTAGNVALTNLEVDGNFKSLNDDIQTRATIASPTFTGVATTAAGSTTVAGGLKLTAGTVKTTPIAGDSGGVEFDGTRVTVIDSTGTRKSIAYSTDISTTATNVNITDDAATAVAVYPVFSSGNTGSLPLKVTSTKLSYVPSTGVLSSTTFSGNLTGTSLKTNNITGGLVGSIPVQSALDTTALLAGNITTTKQFLGQTGNGTVSASPVWSVVTKTDVGLSSVENTALTTWVGANTIVTVGTITTGTWSGTAIAVANGGTGGTTSTGSGSVVLSNSPVLVTPTLGTPVSGNLANCTFPTLNQSTTGTAGLLSTFAAGGTTEVGRILDFHSSTSANDYDVRIDAGTTTGALGANTLTITAGGGLVCSGNVTAYSDERLKEDWRGLGTDFLINLANTKMGTYTRIDTGVRQVGVSAQSLQKTMAEAVVESEDGQLSVAYGNAALAACVMLAREVNALRAEVAALKV